MAETLEELYRDKNNMSEEELTFRKMYSIAVFIRDQCITSYGYKICVNIEDLARELSNNKINKKKNFF